MFNSEQEMSVVFEKFLKENFGNSYMKECKGLFGIPDFVYYDKNDDKIELIAFELKLKDWKQAMKQAFRYKSFSNISYVVIPSVGVNVALKNIELFKKYNIGLAGFNSLREFEILFKPKSELPYSDNLKDKMLQSFKYSRKRSKGTKILVSQE
ncbi:hypothetical protein K6T82_14275 [Flavobacterium sp. 17A]|uniref:Uncharacterized protein n=1 Tax=Flavobacterium potami TaxID=2872310 RepID=A0A9X1HC68_9FLAO|nr:hypothetical protein [Flavobacterium potami]MBZ4035938.1 hypothetical protein [Flavobacterium potami]